MQEGHLPGSGGKVPLFGAYGLALRLSEAGEGNHATGGE